MTKHLLHPSLRRVSVGCGKCRKNLTEEVVFALGCHSVIKPTSTPQLICEMLASVTEQGTAESRVDVVGLLCGCWQFKLLEGGSRCPWV